MHPIVEQFKQQQLKVKQHFSVHFYILKQPIQLYNIFTTT